MGIIGSQGATGQGAALNRQRQGGHGFHNEQESKQQSEQPDSQRPMVLAS